MCPSDVESIALQLRNAAEPGDPKHSLWQVAFPEEFVLMAQWVNRNFVPKEQGTRVGTPKSIVDGDGDRWTRVQDDSYRMDAWDSWCTEDLRSTSYIEDAYGIDKEEW